nr:S-methyl-5-thioribose-1-phosphate isomerase [Anaerolineae bacterium]
MRTVEWHEGKVRMIDQRALPWDIVLVEFRDYTEVAQSISEMIVRGAPAIGAAAAFGMVLAARQFDATNRQELLRYLEEAGNLLVNARPTAVNLKWAVNRMLQAAANEALFRVEDIRNEMLRVAKRIANQDVKTNRQMGVYGAALIRSGDRILHHCNTGALATVDWGTALGVIKTAHQQGKHIQVLLTETRPRMQGARLSAWELNGAGIPYHIITDSAAGHFMRKGEVDLILVGSDRTAANGDVANKIGTYSLAVLARENGIPFYAVVPTSTIDLSVEDGSKIPIEERTPDEIRNPYGMRLVPEHFPVKNPAFDVTPYRYITGIITEQGIAYPPYDVTLPMVVEGSLNSELGDVTEPEPDEPEQLSLLDEIDPFDGL